MSNWEKCDSCNAQASFVVGDIPFHFMDDQDEWLAVGELMFCGHHKHKYTPHIIGQGYSLTRIGDES